MTFQTVINKNKLEDVVNELERFEIYIKPRGPGYVLLGPDDYQNSSIVGNLNLLNKNDYLLRFFKDLENENEICDVLDYFTNGKE